jgi:hypothetical protein
LKYSTLRNIINENSSKVLFKKKISTSPLVYATIKKSGSSFEVFIKNDKLDKFKSLDAAKKGIDDFVELNR